MAIASEQRKKLCWNCDAQVDFEMTRCVYCGENLVAPQKAYDYKQVQKDEGVEQSPVYQEQADASLSYSSPFQEKQAELIGKTTDPTHTLSDQAWEDLMGDDLPEFNAGSFFLSFFCLLGGALFLLFGFALIFFSTDGYLTLTWNQDYWWIFLSLACVLLLTGWNKLGAGEK